MSQDIYTNTLVSTQTYITNSQGWTTIAAPYNPTPANPSAPTNTATCTVPGCGCTGGNVAGGPSTGGPSAPTNTGVGGNGGGGNGQILISGGVGGFNGTYNYITWNPSFSGGIDTIAVEPTPKEAGCSCTKCRDFNEYAEPNQLNGTFICYSCRRSI